jgi:AraC family L-rhamnose operon regulatory protein RhaS
MDRTTTGIIYHKNVVMPFTAAKSSDIGLIISNKGRYKIFLIDQGKVILSINSKKYFISQKVLIVLNEIDEISVIESHDAVFHACFFHPSVINDKFDFANVNVRDASFTSTDVLDLYALIPFKDIAQTKIIKPDLMVYKKMAKLFSSISIMLNVQNDEFWPCKSRSYLIELLHLLSGLCNKFDGMPSDKKIELEIDDIEDVTSRVLLHLHSNYEKKITIENLTKEFCTNRTTLSKLFKRKTGASIMEYLNNLRVDMASQMLRDTQCTVFDIAERTGFSDISYFGRIFKKHYGMNPVSYKRQFGKIDDEKNDIMTD